MSTDLHQLAGAYSLNALPEDEHPLFDNHLRDCPDCQTEVRGLQEVAARLGSAVSESPPPAMRARVLALAARTRQDAPPPPVVASLAAHRAARLTGLRVLAVAAASFAIVAGGLGVAAYQASQRDNRTTVAEQQIADIVSAPDAQTLHTTVQGGGAATLVISRQLDRAVVIATDLPGIDNDRTYQLWAMDASGNAIPGALIDPTSTLTDGVVPLAASTTTIGMTIEPAGGSSAPTTKPILAVKIPA